MTASNFDIVAIGEINPDLILSGNAIPEFDQVEKLVDNAEFTIGSSTMIFACGAARLGLTVAVVGKVGDDPFGHFMLDELQTSGIDVGGVRIDPSLQTGFTLILANGNDRAILTYPGAIPSLTYEDIPMELVNHARHIHVGSYFLQTNLQADIPKLFDRVHVSGISTSLDTNFDPSEKWDGGVKTAIEKANVFLPNLREVCAIAGKEDVESAMASLVEGRRTIAVKLGAQGAVARQAEEVNWALPLPVNVVDTVGAGDSFDAGFLYGWLKDWPLGKSLRLAVVCGSLSTTAAGGTAGQPTLDEAMKFL